MQRISQHAQLLWLSLGLWSAVFQHSPCRESLPVPGANVESCSLQPHPLLLPLSYTIITGSIEPSVTHSGHALWLLADSAPAFTDKDLFKQLEM